MYETVEVVKKNKDNMIDVSCPTTACENCSGNMFCNVKGKSFEAYVDPKFDDIKVGDKARLYLPPKKTISSTFITLMVPLLFFPLFYLIFPVGSVGLRFLISCIGVVVGFFAVSVYFKKSKSKYTPSVNYVYSEGESYFDDEDIDAKPII
jgi:sigma-E factor negative regulatory protein RseC